MFDNISDNSYVNVIITKYSENILSLLVQQYKINIPSRI